MCSFSATLAPARLSFNDSALLCPARASAMKLLARSSTFLSARPFSITLEFRSLGAALAFRLDFYQTRKFLNHLRDRNKPEISLMLHALSGLNRLSCARCDREPALRHLNDFGYVPLFFSTKEVANDDIESQFDALGLSAIDKSINTVTLTNKEFMAAWLGGERLLITPYWDRIFYMERVWE